MSVDSEERDGEGVEIVFLECAEGREPYVTVELTVLHGGG